MKIRIFFLCIFTLIAQGDDSSFSFTMISKSVIPVADQWQFIKNLCYGTFLMAWYAPSKVMQRAGICCNKCLHSLSSIDFCAYRIHESLKIKMLKLYWRINDIADLENFMCYSFETSKQICFYCGNFYGWHIAHPELVENNNSF